MRTHVSQPQAIGRSVTVNGKRVYFDFSEVGGPLVTTRAGEPLEVQPVAEDDPFWPPFNRWMANYYRRKGSA